MTPDAQQPEYFLIEVNDLEILEEVLKDSMQRRILARTRTRPHSPAPEYADRHEAYLEGLRDARLNADKAARKVTLAENKRVLDEIRNTIKYEGVTGLIRKIESLRQLAGEQR